ncbi:hypothetical protein [Bacillus dakarensis]|uniref:hypothetical protein n=1 Tax=Robertmurraya dakarensis TaxID=1926278 RepID=UPI00098138A1|nr:hypothetical protein [Bacillus dakarensis]
MNMYEIILDIIDKKGPVTFTSILNELNEMPLNSPRKRPVQLSHIKSVVSRKKDLFSVENDLVSIREEKEFLSLSVYIAGILGPSYKLTVDFSRNRFYFFDLIFDSPQPKERQRVYNVGSVEEFKKEIYRLKIWDWEQDYQPDSLVLDGTSWSVKLRTKATVYESEGLQCFPKDWFKFCKSISKLTGIKFQ